MDPLYEEEIFAEDQTPKGNFISHVLQFVATYGWYFVGGAAVVLYGAHLLRPRWQRWREAREDAEYHKDPDKALARMEAIQRARERQQQQLLEASQRALELQKEREEKKRQEALERLKKYGTPVGSGHRLGAEEDYLPLSGGASTSSYKPPKRKACGGGGCGR